jgi:hypothetical protein
VPSSSRCRSDRPWSRELVGYGSGDEGITYGRFCHDTPHQVRLNTSLMPEGMPLTVFSGDELASAR